MEGVPEPRIMMAEIIGEPRVNKNGPYGEEVAIDATLTQQGVHNGGYKDDKTIVQMAQYGFHRWVCDSHPWTIVITSPDDAAGYQDNVKVETVKMTKTWEENGEEVTETIDAPKITATLHVVKAWNPDLYEDVVNKVRKAVSVGYWAQVYDRPGVFMGTPYNEVETNVLLDHTGILKPGEQPACEYALLNRAMKAMLKQKGSALLESAQGGQGGVDMTDSEPEKQKNDTPPKPPEAEPPAKPEGDGGGQEPPEAPESQNLENRIAELEARDRANTAALAKMKAEKDAQDSAKVAELAVELANITGMDPKTYEGMSLPEINGHLETAKNARTTHHNELRGVGNAPLGNGGGGKPSSNVSTWDSEKGDWVDQE